jgi:hypothetical protein
MEFLSCILPGNYPYLLVIIATADFRVLHDKTFAADLADLSSNATYFLKEA